MLLHSARERQAGFAGNGPCSKQCVFTGEKKQQYDADEKDGSFESASVFERADACAYQKKEEGEPEEEDCDNHERGMND